MSEPGRVGLIGYPVEHSLSPAFQQAAFDALGLAVRYELWPTTAAQLPARLKALRAGTALGANVTIPHKEAVFAAMDEVTDLARRVGAVNTIIPRAGCLTGDNTDVYGFLAPLRKRLFDFASCDAMVLGAGGAARGVVVALLDSGIRRVVVVNRSAQRAEAIVRTLADTRLVTVPMDDMMHAAVGAGLLINATSLGWSGTTSPCDRSTFDALGVGALAYDLTYRDTPFLRDASAAGIEIIDGLPMLVHQGARSFELWTGLEAPVPCMWEAAVLARSQRLAASPHD